jgi:hypothetical protein
VPWFPFGEHPDRSHSDDDLVGWVDDVGDFDPIPARALLTPFTHQSHSGLRAELLDRA